MKICILSDSHDNISLLCAAVSDALQRGAEEILHCGDIVAPSTLQKLSPYGLPIHAIHGNNTGDLYSLAKLSSRPHSLIQYYGQDADITLDGRRIFVVHYPHYAKGMAATGNYDLVCCGHTHRVAIDTVPNVKGGQTIICNPGTVSGVDGAPATYLLGDLRTLGFEIIRTYALTPPQPSPHTGRESFLQPNPPRTQGGSHSSNPTLPAHREGVIPSTQPAHGEGVIPPPRAGGLGGYQLNELPKQLRKF